MKRRALFLLFLTAITAIGASDLASPILGMARNSRNELRLVYGVTGNFILRGRIGTDVRNWAFTGSGGLLETGTEVIVLDAHGQVIHGIPASYGEVLLGSGGAFFGETGELRGLDPEGGQTAAVTPALAGAKVIALGTFGLRSRRLALCRAMQLWLVDVDSDTGSVIREASPGGVIGAQACRPENYNSFLVLDGLLLLATAHDLVIQPDSGNERSLAFPGSPGIRPQIHRAGEQWVELEFAGLPAMMARIAGGTEKLYFLPGLERSK